MDGVSSTHHACMHAEERYGEKCMGPAEGAMQRPREHATIAARPLPRAFERDKVKDGKGQNWGHGGAFSRDWGEEKGLDVSNAVIQPKCRDNVKCG